MYVARYHLTPRLRRGSTVLVLMGAVMLSCAALGPVVVLGADDIGAWNLFKAVGGMVVLGAFGVMAVRTGVNWHRAGAQNWDALVVDEHGVWLERGPELGTRAIRLPWRDIGAIELFAFHGRGIFRSRVGDRGIAITMVPGAERPTRPFMQPTGPGDVYRTIRGWDLDLTQVAYLASNYAPHVRVVDNTAPGHPDRRDLAVG